MYTHISILTSKIIFELIYNEAISPSCRPPSNLVVKKKRGADVKKVASNQLKIGQRVGIG